MRIVMTLMVRDEADVIGAMLEHHRAQGIDHVIVTDNASEDGTTEILEEYAASGFVTLWHDPEHRKQQYEVVTRMARHAAVVEGADWVINADADEFWLGTSGGGSLRDRLELVAADVDYFEVPVVNLTGVPARDGSGFTRLRYRDHRTQDELHAAGIPFHPTSNALHRGNADVEVAQGNHFVKAPGWGAGVPSDEIEVLHLPWRSWRQYESKVRKAGQAYEANPHLFPSPRHHGMQDYRRWKAGRLEALYVAKHPTPEELDELLGSSSLIEDVRLASLADAGIAGVRSDTDYSEERLAELLFWGRKLAALESENEDRMEALRSEQAYERSLWVAGDQAAADRIAGLERELTAVSGRLTIRAADQLGRIRDRILRRDHR